MEKSKTARDFNWINQGLFNGKNEVLNMSSFLLTQSMENPELSTPVMYVDIDDVFGFPHPLYQP